MQRQEYEQDNDERNAGKRGISSIGSLLRDQPKPEKEKPRGGVNHPFNDAVSRIVELMDEPGKFGYWCGRLRRIAPSRIDSMRSIAMRDGKKPRAYFVFLLKKYREEEKEAKKLSTVKVDTTALPGV